MTDETETRLPPDLALRLLRFREHRRSAAPDAPDAPDVIVAHGEATSDRLLFRDLAATAAIRPSIPDRRARADRLAGALGGHVEARTGSAVVRIRHEVDLPLARESLAALPWHVDRTAPLVCLDTETTGLGTAAGTLIFLIGIGRWTGDRFAVEQLVLPDQPDEPALLDALRSVIPADAWLVTYNGSGFDWPLIVTRYRLHRSEPPVHAGHLDLLPVARRLWRHRLENARLSSVERGVVGVERLHDLPGALIPARYIEFLRTGSPAPLREVVRHNRQDVISLARLVAHLGERAADPAGSTWQHPGDLAALGREYVRRRRLAEGLACCREAVAAAEQDRGAVQPPLGRRDVDRLRADLARTLRAAGQAAESRSVWIEIAEGGGPLAAVAWIQVAKHAEHVHRDLSEALLATERAAGLIERGRLFGRELPRLERDVARRLSRLRRRLARQRSASPRRALS